MTDEGIPCMICELTTTSPKVDVKSKRNSGGRYDYHTFASSLIRAYQEVVHPQIEVLFKCKLHCKEDANNFGRNFEFSLNLKPFQVG
jgi:hypothetical protein